MAGSGGETEGDHLPVDHFPEIRDIIGSDILFVDIVGVFPDIAGKQRLLSVAQGTTGIRCLDNLQFPLFILYQPGPSRSEKGGGSLVELDEKLLHRVKISFKCFFQGALRFTSTFGRELLKIEGVVKNLGSVVEDPPFSR